MASAIQRGQRSTIQDRLAFPMAAATPPTMYPGLCANGDVGHLRLPQRKRSAHHHGLGGTPDRQASGAGHCAPRAYLGPSGRRADTTLNPTQAYNWVGTTNIDAPVAPARRRHGGRSNTNSRERSTDVSASVVSDLSASVQSFVGLRSAMTHPQQRAQ